jgi:hypothetical protein
MISGLVAQICRWSPHQPFDSLAQGCVKFWLRQNRSRGEGRGLHVLFPGRTFSDPMGFNSMQSCEVRGLRVALQQANIYMETIGKTYTVKFPEENEST